MEKSEGVVKVETAKKGVDALRRKETRLTREKTPFDDFAKAHAVIIGVFSLFVKGSTRFSFPNFPKRAYFHAETSLRQSFFNTFSSKSNAPSGDAKKFFQKSLKIARKNLQSLFVFVKITFVSGGKSDYFRFSVVATRFRRSSPFFRLVFSVFFFTAIAAAETLAASTVATLTVLFVYSRKISSKRGTSPPSTR